MHKTNWAELLLKRSVMETEHRFRCDCGACSHHVSRPWCVLGIGDCGLPGVDRDERTRFLAAIIQVITTVCLETWPPQWSYKPLTHTTFTYTHTCLNRDIHSHLLCKVLLRVLSISWFWWLVLRICIHLILNDVTSW